jgi:hypothetical protein
MRTTGRRWRTVLCATALPLLLLVPAHAATLGGLTARSIAADDWTGSSGAAAVVSCDSFTGTTGATMSGRAVVTAASCNSRVWTTHLGTWTIQGNLAAASSTTNANATLNVSAANGSVQAVLSAMNSNGRIGGVVGSHNGSSTYLAAVLSNASQDVAQIRLYQSGVPTVLATTNITLSASHTLRLTRSGSSVTVRLNDTLILSATLSAAQVTALGAGGRAGLLGGQASVRFNDLLVTSP